MLPSAVIFAVSWMTDIFDVHIKSLFGKQERVMEVCEIPV